MRLRRLLADDRVRLGLVALAVIVALNVALALLDNATEGPSGRPFSSYATQPAGLAAWAELLDRAGHPVAALRRRPAERPLDPAQTLVVIEPRDVEAEDARALADFVRRGGRLVAGGSEPAAWLDTVLARPPRWVPAGASRAEVVVPVPDAGGADSLALAGRGTWAASGGALPVAVAPGGNAVLAVAEVGRGRVALLADPSPLQNRRLDQADNAALALGLAGEPGRAVRFAEIFHGYGEASGFGALPERARWVLAGLGLALLTWVLARSRRLGPPDAPGRILAPPRSAYVRAVAGGVARAGRREEAVAPVRAAVRERLPAGGAPGAAVAVLERPVESDEDVLTLGRELARLEARR